MRHRWYIGGLALLLAIFGALNSTQASYAQETDPQTNILIAINAQRSSLGLAPLSINEQLNTIAIIRSQDMVTRHYFSHHDPINGQLVILPLARNNGFYSYFGENLGRTTAQYNQIDDQLFPAWMNSPAHKANIEADVFREVGIGTAYDSTTGHWVVTLLFSG